MSLTEKLAEQVRACFTGLWIESHEHEDALRDIAALLVLPNPQRLVQSAETPGLYGRNVTTAEDSRRQVTRKTLLN